MLPCIPLRTYKYSLYPPLSLTNAMEHIHDNKVPTNASSAQVRLFPRFKWSGMLIGSCPLWLQRTILAF